MTCFPQCLYQFTFPPTVREDSLFSTLFPPFAVCRFFDDGHFDWCKVIHQYHLIVVLICVSLMANRWRNSGNSVRLYFLGSKITVDGDCSHEIKRHLLLGRKVMTNLDSIFKSREITLLTKSQGYGFSSSHVWM